MTDPREPPPIEMTDDPAPQDVAALYRALIAFNEEKAGNAERRPLGLFVRGAAGEPIAGLTGLSAWGWLFVQYLFVSDELRGQGVGSRLLRAAEDEARARGCVGVWLDTFSFQALPFYQRHGYRVFGTVTDYPPGGARHFLLKRLDVVQASAG